MANLIWSNYSEGLGPNRLVVTLSPAVFLGRIGSWHRSTSTWYFLNSLLLMFWVPMVAISLHQDVIFWLSSNWSFWMMTPSKCGLINSHRRVLALDIARHYHHVKRRLGFFQFWSTPLELSFLMNSQLGKWLRKAPSISVQIMHWNVLVEVWVVGKQQEIFWVLLSINNGKQLQLNNSWKLRCPTQLPTILVCWRLRNIYHVILSANIFPAGSSAQMFVTTPGFHWLPNGVLMPFCCHHSANHGNHGLGLPLALDWYVWMGN